MSYRADLIIRIMQHDAIASRSSALTVTTTRLAAMALISKARSNLGIVHFPHLAHRWGVG